MNIESPEAKEIKELIDILKEIIMNDAQKLDAIITNTSGVPALLETLSQTLTGLTNQIALLNKPDFTQVLTAISGVSAQVADVQAQVDEPVVPTPAPAPVPKPSPSPSLGDSLA